MLVFGPNGVFKAEAKTTGVLVRKRIQGWWKKIQELSKERTESCSLCIAQAKLLIFDEPFSGFDPTIKG
jgi:ABC-type uncharacterized transport system ATPase subunit